MYQKCNCGAQNFGIRMQSWKYPPRQRSLAPGDGMLHEAAAYVAPAPFQAVPSVSGSVRSVGAYGVLDILNAWREAQQNARIIGDLDGGSDGACDCLAAGCGARFVGSSASAAAARHARTSHLWPCTAEGCGLAFLTMREANLHCEEAHSPLFAVLSEHKDMYACWVDGCTRRTRTAGARWQHLLTVHRLPPEHAGPAPAASIDARSGSTSRCRYFNTAGGCSRGTACRYAHERGGDCGPASALSTDSVLRVAPPTRSAPSFGRLHARGLSNR